jgi:hypothetical protein
VATRSTILLHQQKNSITLDGTKVLVSWMNELKNTFVTGKKIEPSQFLHNRQMQQHMKQMSELMGVGMGGRGMRTTPFWEKSIKLIVKIHHYI